ncbi:CbiX/SirB N-terminal domain-containing protein [Nocardioides sp. LHD-245]|uniref:sirohydrochlorin chelatase n=1 Tax=Nocardioides sp. LHD-245 TaxID=3051387 RepID=UPI0027E0D732|nr:CbiX/SirB N-terminal domain-containing protein [Nocardioides sp. LHD-245]
MRSDPGVTSFVPWALTHRTNDATPAPHLVTVAHGTRTAAGNEVARELTAAAARRLGWPATTSYVELCAPSFADVVMEAAEFAAPTVAVPLLLSTGYHLRQDLPAAVGGAGRDDVHLGRALGPDRLLAVAQVDRLHAAGARPGQPVVMVAAGSNDPAATADLAAAAHLLGQAWGAPVRLATLAGRGLRPDEVVRPGDAVSPYLLATGHFHRRARRDAYAAGAQVVADVLGAHPRVVDLVVERARALARAATRISA